MVFLHQVVNYDDLVICALLQCYDPVRIMETRWKVSHDWNITMRDMYSLGQRAGKTRKGSCLLCERTAGVHGGLSEDDHEPNDSL